jgi:alanine dehydrogenase
MLPLIKAVALRDLMQQLTQTQHLKFITRSITAWQICLKYSLSLANKGWQKAMEDDAGLAAGLNVHEGKIMYAAVAAAHG